MCVGGCNGANAAIYANTDAITGTDAAGAAHAGARARTADADAHDGSPAGRDVSAVTSASANI